MLKLISAVFFGILLLASCEVELPAREVDCFLDIDERSSRDFRISIDTVTDTNTAFFNQFDASAFVVTSKSRNDDGSYTRRVSMIQSDSASRLFFVANPLLASTCISQVTKGDTIGSNYLKKSGLYNTGRQWCNDCEILLFSSRNGQIDCGGALNTTIKAPFSVETGAGANYGWFEFLISEHNFFLLKTNLANQCEEVVVR